MTEDEMRRAVQEPARRVNLDFEAGLVDTILDDVGVRERSPQAREDAEAREERLGLGGRLPLLEFALEQLYHERVHQVALCVGTAEPVYSRTASHGVLSTRDVDQTTSNSVELRSPRATTGTRSSAF